MNLHRRLRSLLVRSGVSGEPEQLTAEQWRSLAQQLNAAFTRWELETLQHERTAASQKREIQALFTDLAGEHLKLESVLNTLPQALAGLDAQGNLLFATSGFEQLLGAGELAPGAPVLTRMSPSAASLSDLLGGRDSLAVHLVTPEGERPVQLLATWNGGRLLGAVLHAEWQPSSPSPGRAVAAAAPVRVRPDVFGFRLAVLLPPGEESEGMRQRLQGIGAAVLFAPPTAASLDVLRQAGELHALLLDPAAWQLTDALEKDPVLARVPLLAVVPAGRQGYEAGSVSIDAAPDDLARALLEIRSQGFPTEEQVEGPPRLRVLVVDDEPVTRMIVEECVLSLGHECHVAEDGAEAWRMHSQQPFNVIISDWVMPSTTGVELCGMVRSHVRECYTYFILLTGKKDSPQVSEAVSAAGADDYLTKPLNPTDIERRLQVAARFAARERQLRNGAPLRSAAFPTMAAGTVA
jgi:CheY-like chemotaxis protein